MVKIRLTRFGRKNLPFFRVVAMEASTKRDGKAISFLGTYDPVSKVVNLKSDDIRKFLANGAQPTETVRGLLKRSGIEA